MHAHQLVYVSAASRLLPQSELADILAKARRKNATLGVTGILIHDSGSFLQVLEGAEESVEGLFRTIGLDPRHRRVVVLSRRAAARSFADWSMGFADHADASLNALPGFKNLVGEAFDPARLTAFKTHAFYIIEAFSVGRLRQHAAF